MSEMIERVAEAIEAYYSRKYEGDPREVARAVIEAMREPTEAMDEEGAIYSDCNAATPTWRAMIDAALGKIDA